LLLTIIFSCSAQTQNRLNCICLIDYSGSLSEATLENYINIISFDIFQNLNEKDRLIVLPIDEGAKIKAVKIVYEDFSEHKFSNPTDGFTHAREHVLKRIHDYAISSAPRIHDEIEKQKELRKKFTYYTDILSALEQCKPLLETNTEDNFWQSIDRFFSGKRRIISDNLIVLFSDMIQESSEVNFNNSTGCSVEESKKILAGLAKNNRIPNLTHCSVFVNGRTGQNNLQVDNIKNFWMNYFKATNADLIVYDFDCSEQLKSYLLNRRAQIK
jgi:hypothetical protein